MLGGNGLSDKTFTVESDLKWRVLRVENDQVILISNMPTRTLLPFSGAVMYLFAEQEINNICGIYGHGAGADTSQKFSYSVGWVDSNDDLLTKNTSGTGARSVNLDDMCKAFYFTSRDANTGNHTPVSVVTSRPSRLQPSGILWNSSSHWEFNDRIQFDLSSRQGSGFATYANMFNAKNSNSESQYAFLIANRTYDPTVVATNLGNRSVTRYYVMKYEVDTHMLYPSWLLDCVHGTYMARDYPATVRTRCAPCSIFKDVSSYTRKRFKWFLDTTR